MKVRVTWPDGSQTEEFMDQEYRKPGEIEQRKDYFIIVNFRGAIGKILADGQNRKTLKY